MGTKLPSSREVKQGAEDQITWLCKEASPRFRLGGKGWPGCLMKSGMAAKGTGVGDGMSGMRGIETRLPHLLDTLFSNQKRPKVI